VAVDTDLLGKIFGEASSGGTPEERARTSNREFVRSQDHLALANTSATGHRISAWEAYQAFGLDKLEETLEYGSAVLVAGPREPAESIRKCREDRGLEIDDIARAIAVDENQIQNAEDPKKTNPIELLERIAMALGLDERQLSFRRAAENEDRLGVRLRKLKDSNPEFTPSTVIAFDEAAWVTQKQLVLSQWTEQRVDLKSLGFEADSRYGDKSYPAWHYGYDLAHATRKNLGLGPDEPIMSLREIVESTLKVPLIHLSLPKQFAGATIAVGSARGIAVNINGLNNNEWVRRATIAHELAHLLWDPDENLQSLIVDTFDELEVQPPQLRRDYVEARANAFAIELLAPKDYAVEVFRSKANKESGIRQVMEHFGVSFTSAKFQIWNALERSIPLESFSVSNVEPTDDWKGRESYTVDFFRPRSVVLSRRGRFAWYVVKAMKQNLISEDSAALFLGCAKDDLKQNADEILQLY
jgi:Zn-dependent peptidase ImmA (M78 family)/transcriptional regulator with XRE-family HTH domain